MEIAAFPNAPAPSRAAQYVRMSTEHQQYSPENQLDIIRQYATITTWRSSRCTQTIDEVA